MQGAYEKYETAYRTTFRKHWNTTMRRSLKESVS